MKITLILAVYLILSGCATGSIYNKFIYKSIPDKIVVDKQYLFFMHGKIVEKKGLPARSKKYGKYKYKDMLDIFAAEGFIVISEPRSLDTDFLDYSFLVSDQVRRLLQAGVPPSHITVSGYSKGGRMTLIVSSLLNYKDIKYVVLAGCRTSDIDNFTLSPTGKVLSIYDSADDRFESCSDIFSVGKDNLQSHEIDLKMGGGHGIFYKPKSEWVQPMLNWAKK